MTKIPVAPLGRETVKTLQEAILAKLEADYPDLEALYRDIHANPELPFQETRTAARLASEMRALGFEVAEGVGGTGLVATFSNGDGPAVLVRTELDGLPIREATGLAYASLATGLWKGEPAPVMHSCGHDLHMAIWVGVARQLVALKDCWRGALVFVAQPAEETGEGALAMLADGFVGRFGLPDYGFALHVAPFRAGVIAYKGGVITSNADSLGVTFKGRGGHGSMPDLAIDPILMAARFTVEVQGVVSREKDPFAFGVVSIGAIHGGEAGNVIPECCRLHGTIRTLEAAVRGRIIEGVRRTAVAVADMAGAPEPEIVVRPAGRAVVNDEDLAAHTGPVFEAAFGEMAKVAPRPGPASEDFSEFILAGVPSLFFMVGGFSPEQITAARQAGAPGPIPHSPTYAPLPGPTIRSGVEAMTLAVLNVAHTGV